jgi:A/G-specific adenine glycosylase
MMELGATVCTPRAPRCDACPLAAWCTARQRVRAHEAAAGDASQAPPAVTDYPTKAVKAPRREEAVRVRVVEWVDSTSAAPHARHLLMLRRPPGGLLGGQWEFPSVTAAADAPAGACSAALDAKLLGLGLADARCTPSSQPAARVMHVFSHIQHDMHVERVVLLRDAPPPELTHADRAAWRWLEQPGDGSAPDGMTGGVRKAWEAVMNPLRDATQQPRSRKKQKAKA